MKGLIPFVLLCALVGPQATAAQDNDFENLFSSYSGANATGYLTPLAEILGGSLNSGFVKPVRLDDDGFHIRLDVQLAAVFVSDSQKEFQGTTDGGFTPETTTAAPTILGAGTATTVQGDVGTSFVFPAGLAITRTILPIPQITVGNVAGTDASIRWLGVGIDDVGDFSLLGIGARHSVSQYFPELPVDVAVGLHYHTVSLGDLLDLKAGIFSVQASRRSERVSLYGGVGYETSSMDVTYDADDADQGEVAISLDGASGVRATGGLAFHLPGITLFGDFTLGSQSVAAFGIGIGN